MRTLNLDPMFIPVQAPSLEYSSFVFPGGEHHIKVAKYDPSMGPVVITHRIKNAGDIMLIALAVEALRGMGATIIDLYIPYIPYARQDRRANEGESLSIKVFTNMINALNFNKVIVIDPHSDVAPALINNCEIINHTMYSTQMILKKHLNDRILIVPDIGANKRCDKVNNLIHFPYVIQCTKKRDTLTGKLFGFNVLSSFDLKGKNCLIYDDICDGGGTFIGLAKTLKELGASSVELYVTHGIFSNGFDVLKDYIDHIYCTNSFSDIDNPLVSQILIDSYKLREFNGI